MLEPIEDHLRPGEPLDDGPQLIIRGWPLNPEGLMRNARQTSQRYSLEGSPLVAVSAELIMAGWTLERILSGRRLGTRVSYAAVTVGDVLESGFMLLPTFDPPHYSIVWTSYTEDQAARLSRLFDPAIRNPYYAGRAR
jgi:hypothetical protein